MGRIAGRYAWSIGLGCCAAVLLSCGSDEEPAATSDGGPVSVADAPIETNEFLMPDRYRASFTGDLPEIRERRVLRALLSPSRTDFFVHGGRPRGLQIELLEHFEKFLNEGASRSERIEIVYIPVNFEELLPALLAGRGDLTAGFLTITEERQKQVAFATGRSFKVSEVIVMARDADPVDTLDDLAGRTVTLMRGSSYETHLRDVSRQIRRQGRPRISITAANPHLVTEDLLELVNAGLVEITVADDFRARLWAPLLPNLVVREDLVVHADGNVGWAIRPDNPELLEVANRFAGTIRIGTLLGNMLFKRYYANTRWIEDPTKGDGQEQLLEYASLFQKYGDQYGFHWLALAAQAYQESGLDHSRRSAAGAVGLMQVLPSTAADPKIGIDDVTDLESNVHAGAKYMALLRDTYFAKEDLAEDERMAFIWAAYNAGPTSVRRMRAKAREMGLDPNRWFGNVEYAAQALVGNEPVRYVSNIFKYYLAYKDMLALSRAKSTARS